MTGETVVVEIQFVVVVLIYTAGNCFDRETVRGRSSAQMEELKPDKLEVSGIPCRIVRKARTPDGG